MQDLMWEIETAAGETHRGTDSMPKPELKEQARVLRLSFPGCPHIREVQVPPGGRLVLIRSTELLVREGDNKVLGKKVDFKYGFKVDGRKAIVEESVRAIAVQRWPKLLRRARLEEYRVFQVKDSDGRSD